MTKTLNFALKINGGGREGATRQKFGTCTWACLRGRLKFTKFQLPPLKGLSTVVKNIFFFMSYLPWQIGLRNINLAGYDFTPSLQCLQLVVLLFMSTQN